jgi:hypothetical protein
MFQFGGSNRGRERLVPQLYSGTDRRSRNNIHVYSENGRGTAKSTKSEEPAPTR